MKRNNSILIHILLFIFTAGIGNIIYLIYQYNKKTTTMNTKIKIEDDDKILQNRLNETELWKNNNMKYKTYLDRHYEILETLNFNLYSKAINNENIFNSYSDECIKLCYEDLELAPKVIEYWKEDSKIRNEKYIPLNYGSHKILIKLLEKQKKYDDAIIVCDKYIDLGLNNDGTKGGIIARKEKIIKLKNT